MKMLRLILLCTLALCSCQSVRQPAPPMPPLPTGAPARVVRAPRSLPVQAVPPQVTDVSFKTVQVNTGAVTVAVLTWKNVPAGLARVYVTSELPQMRELSATLRFNSADYVLDDYTFQERTNRFYHLKVEALTDDPVSRDVIFDEWRNLLIQP